MEDFVLQRTVVMLFNSRTLFMGMSGPVFQALLMDVAPAHERARWEALNTIKKVSFAGTSILGGYLIEWYGYGYSIMLTVAFGAPALLFIIPIWCAIPRFEADAEAKKSEMM